MDHAPASASVSDATPNTEQFAAAIREAEDWAAAAYEARRRLEALDATADSSPENVSLRRL